jgi:hypothetical protein
VAKSLVSVTDYGEVLRYWLLESVRIYAEEKLVETGESERLRSAQRDWYLEWIESLPLEQVRSFRGFGSASLVLEADNLTAALEWCRQQGQFDLCARIAVRMINYWYFFVRLHEMMAWWRDLDAGLPAGDRGHRAMALLLRGWAAALAGEWEEVDMYSAQALALADPQGWVGAWAQGLQAIYWAANDPPRSDRLWEGVFELDASMGMAPDQLGYQGFYLSRLLRANGRDEAFALLHDWQALTPTHTMAAAFALYGDTRTALELTSRVEPASVPMEQFLEELAWAVLASAQGQFEEAERHLVALAAVVRDYAIPGGEGACLIGFANVALDRRDYARASGLLASVIASAGPGGRPRGGPRGSLLQALVYTHCTEILQGVLDPESARVAQAKGRALSLNEVLDAELVRSGTTNVASGPLSLVRAERASTSGPEVAK